MVLAKKLLAWCPMDNLGVRFLLGDITLITGDRKAAMKEYLNGAANSPDRHPNAWYQTALIAFRDGDYVAACTYLRRGIAANPYIAEGLTGRTLIAEHLTRMPATCMARNGRLTILNQRLVIGRRRRSTLLTGCLTLRRCLRNGPN